MKPQQMQNQLHLQMCQSTVQQHQSVQHKAQQAHLLARHNCNHHQRPKLLSKATNQAHLLALQPTQLPALLPEQAAMNPTNKPFQGPLVGKISWHCLPDTGLPETGRLPPVPLTSLLQTLKGLTQAWLPQLPKVATPGTGLGKAMPTALSPTIDEKTGMPSMI